MANAVAHNHWCNMLKVDVMHISHTHIGRHKALAHVLPVFKPVRDKVLTRRSLLRNAVVTAWNSCKEMLLLSFVSNLLDNQKNLIDNTLPSTLHREQPRKGGPFPCRCNEQR